MAFGILKRPGLISASAVAGALMVLAFPPFDVAGLGWVAPGLLFFCAVWAGPSGAFTVGFVSGLVWWLGSLYWLLHIPVAFLPILGWLALGAYLSLYPAAWALWCSRIANLIGGSPRDLAVSLAAVPAWKRQVWALAGACFWITLEVLRCWMLTGFPWNLLGTSQYQVLPVAQLAALTGVQGISFLMVWFSISLMCSVAGMLTRRKTTSLFLSDALLPGIAVLAVVFWGTRELVKIAAQTSPTVLKVALIQPAVPQTLIWDSRENSYRFDKLLKLSQKALKHKPDILVWPEAAVPEMLRYHESTYVTVTNLAISNKIWMIIGSDDMESAGESQDKGKPDFYNYNSAFLVSPRGELVDQYRKRQLVIFGEYVPLSRWLPFLNRLTPVGDGFAAGKQPGDFAFSFGPKTGIEGGDEEKVRVRAGLLICFEDVFPELARDSVNSETDFLLNLTNDGWFRESAAQYQHAANAVFRAVETRRPLVRCTNNGRTCWVDAAGRPGPMQVFYEGDKQDIYAESYRIIEVPVDGGLGGRSTMYQRNGDWLGWMCGLISVIATAWLLRKR